MTNVGTRYLARGRTNTADELLEADGPLAALNGACGGGIGRTLAIPELLALVGKAREYGFRLSRQFSAVDGSQRISAWVDIAPLEETGGCEITIVSWHVDDLAPDRELDSSLRRTEIYRHLAECTMRLDPSQRVHSIETDAPDLLDFANTVSQSVGRPWTNFVKFVSEVQQQPVDWRLLDGSICRITGSDREWTVCLEPLGQPDPGSSGFVLHLSASVPHGRINPSQRETTPSLGKDLTPVLRQPINRIIANAETIRTKLAGPLREEYSDYAADIASAGQHLLALIDDLSDLEVVEAEDFTTAPDRIDLGDVARRACGILGVRAKEREIVLDPPAEGESQMATAEFRRVLQVLLNLIGNAIRYAPKESRIWVRLDSIGNRATITVADQGHGLDERQQEKVFEKFERLGRGDDGGSGLGLYISRRIARAMGGDLTVESAPGQGARFTLSVPVAGE